MEWQISQNCEQSHLLLLPLGRSCCKSIPNLRINTTSERLIIKDLEYPFSKIDRSGNYSEIIRILSGKD